MTRVVQPKRGGRSRPSAEQATIEITLAELVHAAAVLDRLIDVRSFSQRALYQVAKLSRLVAVETQHFEGQRIALLKEFGTQRETTTDAERQKFGPSLFEVSQDKRQAFTDKLVELEQVTVSIAWTPLAFEELAPADLSARELLALGPLVADPVMSGVTDETRK